MKNKKKKILKISIYLSIFVSIFVSILTLFVYNNTHAMQLVPNSSTTTNTVYGYWENGNTETVKSKRYTISEILLDHVEESEGPSVCHTIMVKQNTSQIQAYRIAIIYYGPDGEMIKSTPIQINSVGNTYNRLIANTYRCVTYTSLVNINNETYSVTQISDYLYDVYYSFDYEEYDNFYYNIQIQSGQNETLLMSKLTAHVENYRLNNNQVLIVPLYNDNQTKAFELLGYKNSLYSDSAFSNGYNTAKAEDAQQLIEYQNQYDTLKDKYDNLYQQYNNVISGVQPNLNDLIFQVGATPINVLYRMLSFEILGVNLFTLLSGLVTGALIIFVIAKIFK